MTKEIRFFDSYAIIEIIKGNLSYLSYEDVPIVTTKLNLFEVYQSFIELLGEKEADLFLDKYYSFVIDYHQEIIKEAALMRLKYKKRNISMTDCIGYCIAKKYQIKFLTGDKEFEHFENVEFIK